MRCSDRCRSCDEDNRAVASERGLRYAASSPTAGPLLHVPWPHKNHFFSKNHFPCARVSTLDGPPEDPPEKRRLAMTRKDPESTGTATRKMSPRAAARKAARTHPGRRLGKRDPNGDPKASGVMTQGRPTRPSSLSTKTLRGRQPWPGLSESGLSESHGLVHPSHATLASPLPPPSP